MNSKHAGIAGFIFGYTIAYSAIIAAARFAALFAVNHFGGFGAPLGALLVLLLIAHWCSGTWTLGCAQGSARLRQRLVEKRQAEMEKVPGYDGLSQEAQRKLN